MQQDDRNDRQRRDDLDDIETPEDAVDLESAPNEAWRPSDPDDVPSIGDESVEQGGRSADSPRREDSRSGGRSESERSDRSHQAPHEDHVGRADWAVEGSEGGGDPGGPPRRANADEGTRRKKKT